jgi:hypothetical protein
MGFSGTGLALNIFHLGLVHACLLIYLFKLVEAVLPYPRVHLSEVFD